MAAQWPIAHAPSACGALSNGGFEIWYFIAEDDPVAADRLLDLLEEKYKPLAGNSQMGPARPDIAKLALSPGRELFAALPRDFRRHRTGSPGAWST